LTFEIKFELIYTMNYSLIDDLPNILSRFTKNYMNRRGHIHASDINNGECFVWAWTVHHFLKSRGIDSSLGSCINYGGHAWVEIDNKAYDSVHPFGIDVDDFLFEWTNRNGEDYYGYEEPDIQYMDESDFFDHWVNCGWSGWMLLREDLMMTFSRSISQCGRGWTKAA
jgi:hypothetical protein